MGLVADQMQLVKWNIGPKKIHRMKHGETKGMEYREKSTRQDIMKNCDVCK